MRWEYNIILNCMHLITYQMYVVNINKTEKRNAQITIRLGDI